VAARRVALTLERDTHRFGALVCIAVLCGLSMTACAPFQKRFVPPTQTENLRVERTLMELGLRINAKDPQGVCALYLFPSTHCYPIWKRRIRRFRTPVMLSLRKVTFGCAGDARVTYVERSRNGPRVRTLTVVNYEPGYYMASLSDVPDDDRLSALDIPRYGSCADAYGWAGTPNRDPAVAWAGNGR
jgi:hypothetical protein